ncbi:hypothetical protein X747_14755 [Mesorhizobium sp. LNJC384A00]|nr:hypothetical protein X747_14755 [Mesorhizobium sp. LNJC384A00]
MPSSSQDDDASVAQHLLKLLGEQDFLRFLENFAGCRVYFRSRGSIHEMGEMHQRTDRLVDAIGREAAEKLEAEFGSDYIRAPLAREFRAACYRKQGLTNPKIAVRLGMTETGIDKMFRRMKQRNLAKLRAATNDNRKNRLADDDRPKRRAAGDE